MSDAMWVEWLKLRRSTVAKVVSGAVIVAIPLLSYAMFWVSVNGGFGPLAAKSEGLIVGDGWDGYLNAIGQVTAVGVFLALGVLSAWVFGREHTENTFPSLFSLETSRTSIATAKLFVLIAATAVLALALVVVTLGLGVATGVSDGEVPIPEGLATVLQVAFLAGLLGTCTAYVASVGRGYLAAIGALIGVVAVAQIAVLFGTGGWFPFAVPGLMAVSGAEGVPEVSGAQMLLVPAFVGVVAWWTIRWWRTAEAVA